MAEVRSGTKNVNVGARAGGKTGYYWAPYAPGGATTRALVDGTLLTVPLFWGGSAIDRLGIDVQTAAASSTIRLGIYYDDYGIPGALVIDAGTVDASTTGVKEITVAQALPPQQYWVALVAQGGAPTVRASSAQLSFIGSTSAAVFGTSNIVGYSRTGVSAALPDPFGTVSVDGGAGIRMVVRGA